MADKQVAESSTTTTSQQQQQQKHSWLLVSATEWYIMMPCHIIWNEEWEQAADDNNWREEMADWCFIIIVIIILPHPTGCMCAPSFCSTKVFFCFVLYLLWDDMVEAYCIIESGGCNEEEHL